MVEKSIINLARTIRSKNAGSFFITFEIIFDDIQIYNQIKQNNAITRETVARVYGISPDKIQDFVYYDAGMGIKGNIRRSIPSGGPGESDVYGCQQYAPLLNLKIVLDK